MIPRPFSGTISRRICLNLPRVIPRPELRFIVLLIIVLAPTVATAQDPGACAKCHSEARTQPATHMAHALETVEECRILIEHPLLTANFGKFSYRIERKEKQSFYSVTDGTTTITLPIRWALGASSAMGQTYILEQDGQLYESRMSCSANSTPSVPRSAAATRFPLTSKRLPDA